MTITYIRKGTYNSKKEHQSSLEINFCMAWLRNRVQVRELVMVKELSFRLYFFC